MQILILILGIVIVLTLVGAVALLPWYVAVIACLAIGGWLTVLGLCRAAGVEWPSDRS
jgi:hypothetical protein